MEEYSEFYGFMEEYAGFFEGLVQQEQEKLEALLSNELKDIEQSISAQQAATMRMEKYEKRRMELQNAAGFEELTFRQIIEKAQADQKAPLEALFTRVTQAVDQIKFYNEKSMELVRTNLQLLNDAVSPEKRQEAQSYQASGTQKESWGRGVSLFETKI